MSAVKVIWTRTRKSTPKLRGRTRNELAFFETKEAAEKFMASLGREKDVGDINLIEGVSLHDVI